MFLQRSGATEYMESLVFRLQGQPTHLSESSRGGWEGCRGDLGTTKTTQERTWTEEVRWDAKETRARLWSQNDFRRGARLGNPQLHNGRNPTYAVDCFCMGITTRRRWKQVSREEEQWSIHHYGAIAPAKSIHRIRDRAPRALKNTIGVAAAVPTQWGQGESRSGDSTLHLERETREC